MKLSPKARRFLVRAVRDVPDAGGQAELRAWVEQGAGEDLAPPVTEFALGALKRFEHRMSDLLETGHLDEDRRAEVINDLRFVYAIEADLRREIAKREDVRA